MARVRAKERRRKRLIAEQLEDATRPGVRTPEPATIQQADRLFKLHWRRMLLTFILLFLLSLGLSLLASYTRNANLFFYPYFVLLLVFGFLSSYWLNKTFVQLRELGFRRLEQKRYADAAHVLAYFHRFGNMGFDRDGEIHYRLMLAYRHLGEEERAQKIAEWIARYRPNTPAARKVAPAKTTTPDNQEEKESHAP